VQGSARGPGGREGGSSLAAAGGFEGLEEEAGGPLAGSGGDISEVSVVEDGAELGGEEAGGRGEGSHAHHREGEGRGGLQEIGQLEEAGRPVDAEGELRDVGGGAMHGVDGVEQGGGWRGAGEVVK